MTDMMWGLLGDIVSGVVLFLFGALVQYVRNKSRNDKAIENGLCALLRNNIILIHNEALEKGSIAATQYENVTKMNDAYHELGGNGLVKKMMKEINEMHTRTISRNT